VVSGRSPDRIFVEVIELPDHPWFLACQFHPEFKSRPYDPHPIFKSFIGAAVEYRDQREAKAEAAEEEAKEVVAEAKEIEEAAEETVEETVEAN
jgi:hypothetical protein